MLNEPEAERRIMPERVTTLPAEMCTVLFTGGRVIDPETRLDATLNVGIRNGTITYVGKGTPAADKTIDIQGLVLSPGFIDIHSHAQSPLGLRLQALDGVTTALDLEAGALPIALAYARAEGEGRPINFGFSSSWALARMSVLDGVQLPDDSWANPLPNAVEIFEKNQTRVRWNTHATRREVDAILGRVEEGIAEGGIGIGVLLGYSPDSGREEYFRVAQLGNRLSMPVFTHSRQMSNLEPGSSVDGALEIIAAAAGTGAHTGIGAAFFAPDKLDRMGITPSSIQYLATGERVADIARLEFLRAHDPGGLCIVEYLDIGNPSDLALLKLSFTMPGGIVASDAMPLVYKGGYGLHDEWPPSAGAFTHPRSMGTFARTMRWLVRELSVFSLADAIARCSYLPTTILQDAAPSMRRKGRIQTGADADITIFDPLRITDEASFERIAPSSGIIYVLVNGEFVVAEEELIPTANPGRAVRSGTS
jgi:hypothetical protein